MTSDLCQALKNSTICPLPWISIETTPVGTARACCISRENVVDKNGNDMKINQHGIMPMFESDYIKDLRKQMINGQQPRNCVVCWDEEKVGRQSKRISTIENFHQSLDSALFEQSEKGQVKFLDLKLGNLCNLKCRLCGSWSSSKWAKEEIDTTNSQVARYYLKEGAWPDHSDLFWNQIEQLLSQIDYIEITGGEPFMIENHFRFLRKAIETGDSQRIFVHYNSNGTHLPTHALEDIWPHFKMIEVAFSIDDLGERFHYQRYPANWSEVNNNLEAFWQYRQSHTNFRTQVCCTVDIFNVYFLDEICRWIDSKPFDSIYFNLLHDEPEWSIKNLPNSFKEKIKNKINLSLIPITMRSQIAKILLFMNNDCDKSLFEKRRLKIDTSDKYRNQSFLSTFPELKEVYDNDGK